MVRSGMSSFQSVLAGESRWAILSSECAAAAALTPENSIDAVIIDPPAGIGFMTTRDRQWDSNRGGRDQWIAWLRDQVIPLYRAMKPGAHILVWAIPKTSHWTAMALEDAGFESRDRILAHCYSQGFPKNLNVGKAIDAMILTGHSRPEDFRRLRMGDSYTPTGRPRSGEAMGGSVLDENEGHGSLQTEQAKEWEGWGSALKPSWEPWLLFRKPLSEPTIAANVLKWGTGGLNIDACRVDYRQDAPTQEEWNRKGSSGQGVPTLFGQIGHGLKTAYAENKIHVPSVRWPPNLVLVHTPECRQVGTRRVKANGEGSGKLWSHYRDGTEDHAKPTPSSLGDEDGMETFDTWECVEGCPAMEMDRQSGPCGGGGNARVVNDSEGRSDESQYRIKPTSGTVRDFGDKGGASRFYPNFGWDPDMDFHPFLYVSKPSHAEKNEGCEDLPQPPTSETTNIASNKVWRCFDCQRAHPVGDAKTRTVCVRCGGSNLGLDDAAMTQHTHKRGNTHPTVKPVSLMRWLCRLITPPKGVIADFFCGSGTTGVAAIMEGFRFLGADTDDETNATRIASARIQNAVKKVRPPSLGFEDPASQEVTMEAESLEDLFGL